MRESAQAAIIRIILFANHLVRSAPNGRLAAGHIVAIGGRRRQRLLRYRRTIVVDVLVHRMLRHAAQRMRWACAVPEADRSLDGVQLMLWRRRRHRICGRQFGPGELRGGDKFVLVVQLEVVVYGRHAIGRGQLSLAAQAMLAVRRSVQRARSAMRYLDGARRRVIVEPQILQPNEIGIGQLLRMMVRRHFL